jgi:uncharacterized membrane-anchored protein
LIEKLSREIQDEDCSLVVLVQWWISWNSHRKSQRKALIALIMSKKTICTIYLFSFASYNYTKKQHIYNQTALHSNIFVQPQVYKFQSKTYIIAKFNLPFSGSLSFLTMNSQLLG